MRTPGASTAPCEVLLYLPSDLIWVHPPATDDVPSQDQLVAGVVEVECASDRTLQGLEVRLHGVQVVGYPWDTAPAARPQDPSSLRWEEHVVLDRRLALRSSTSRPTTPRFERPSFLRRDSENTLPAANELSLSRGVHDFEFHFILPAWAAPYERSRYGRTRYTLTAVALGGGKNGANVSATRDLVVVQQQTPDRGPLPLELTYHDTHEALQYMVAALTTPSLTVGGLLTLSLVHPNPPPNLNVLMVRVYVQQKYEVQRKDASEWIEMPLEKLRVWDLGVPPPTHRELNNARYWAQGLLTAAGVQPGGERLGLAARQAPDVVERLDVTTANESVHGYRVRKKLRLPDDNRLRPSTMPGTRTRLRISHEVGVEVLFSRVDVLEDRADHPMAGTPKTQVFAMAKQGPLPSCECTFDAIHLPPYSQASPHVADAPAAPAAPAAMPSKLPTEPPATHGTESEWNNLVHSLTSLTLNGKRLSVPRAPLLPSLPSPGTPGLKFFTHTAHASLAPSREPSPPPARELRLSASRGPSRPVTPDGARSASGLSTPVIPVRRPNDTAASAPLRMDEKVAPRSLPAGSPWAVSHLPPRAGEDRATCVCGMSMEALEQAQQRLLEGAPTAPGAWISASPQTNAPPPWTQSSRPTSPTHNWLDDYAHRGSTLPHYSDKPAV